MGGFMDAFLSLARVLCGTPIVPQESPTEYQRPEVPIQQRRLPPRHVPVRYDTLSKPLPARPKTPPQHRPVEYGTSEQRSRLPTERPPSQFPPYHRPVGYDTSTQVQKPEPVYYYKPEVAIEQPQVPPYYHPVINEMKQELIPVPYYKPTEQPLVPSYHYPKRESTLTSFPKLEVPIEQPRISSYHRPKQESKPVSYYEPEIPVEQPQIPSRHRPKQELKPISYPKPEVPTEQPQIPPQHRPEQEPKPVSYPPLAHQTRQDQDQINNHDDYTALRAKAVEHGDLMARSFQDSHEAYSKGRRALAKQLSEKGKQHERTMESLNAEASAWIFRQNNMDREPGEIDLHCLYVKEAVSYVEKAIEEARGKGNTELRFIVGKGLHSDGRVAKIKPAIEELMKKNNIPTEIDPCNGGVLIVRLC